MMKEAKKIPIYIMGERYLVPSSLTILQAFEYAGYKLVRGVGCRGGFCGACATVFRKEGDYHLRFALACQTRVEPGIQLTMIPFFPAHHPGYDVKKLTKASEVIKIYPEMLTCFGCNTCTKACPQEIDVMGYVSAIIRGDLEVVSQISFDCIMCGLCVVRCPAELVKHNVALLCRRLYARTLAPKSPHLTKRIKEIEEGKFQEAVENLIRLSKPELKICYEKRTIEPE